jgi:hypothetical protein
MANRSIDSTRTMPENRENRQCRGGGFRFSVVGFRLLVVGCWGGFGEVGVGLFVSIGATGILSGEMKPGRLRDAAIGLDSGPRL